VAILWGVRAPKSPCKPGVGIVSVKAGETVEGVILAPVVGVMCHFANGRSAPCVGAQSCTCHGLELRWMGFVAFWSNNRDWKGKRAGRFVSVLAVTKAIGETMETASRGTVVAVSRGGSKANDPLSVELRGQYSGPVPLPEEFDVKPYVLRAASAAAQRILKIHSA